MPRSSSRGGRNPSGRNQYSDWGVMEMARERPVAAAAAAAGAAAAGLFLWSKRAQISDQLGHLTEQFGEWKDSMRSNDAFETAGTAAAPTASRSSARTARSTGMSETGGGSASLGARNGGGGTRTTASGRGRAGRTRTSEMQ